MSPKRFSVHRLSENHRIDAVRIQCDPRTNQFRPGGAPTEQDVIETFDTWLSHWNKHGFGYWAIADSQSPGSPVVGFGGVMQKPVTRTHDYNLYFRLDPTVHGHGAAQFIGMLALHEAFQT